MWTLSTRKEGRPKVQRSFVALNAPSLVTSSRGVLSFPCAKSASPVGTKTTHAPFPNSPLPIRSSVGWESLTTNASAGTPVIATVASGVGGVARPRVIGS